MKTILVVDDDYLLVESLTDLLDMEGYRVVSAGNGKDGLARLEKEIPDLVLTDFMMPIADGLDLIWGVNALPKFRSLHRRDERQPQIRRAPGPPAPSIGVPKQTFWTGRTARHHRTADRKGRT